MRPPRAPLGCVGGGRSARDRGGPARRSCRVGRSRVRIWLGERTEPFHSTTSWSWRNAFGRAGHQGEGAARSAVGARCNGSLARRTGGPAFMSPDRGPKRAPDFRKLLEAAPHVPWVVEPEAWKVVYMGPQALTLCGFPVDDWHDDHFWKGRIHRDDRDRVLPFLGPARLHAGPEPLEYRLVAADGKTVWVQDAVDDALAQSDSSRMSGFLIDISARKHFEKRVVEHERICMAVAQTTADLLFIYDVEADWTEWIGDVEAKIGLSPDEWRRWEHWQTRLHPDDKQRAIEALGQAVEHRASVRIDYRIRHRDGTYRWWDARAVALETDGGEGSKMCGAITDITERTEQEIALQKNIELLTAIVEGTTDVVYVKDREGRYVLVNGVAAAMIRRPKEEIIGRRDLDIFPPEVAARFWEQDLAVIESGEPSVVDQRAQVLDQIREYHTVKIPWRHPDGSILGAVGVARDVTDRRRAERAVLQVGTRERNRIGQDIHDGLGQKLTGIALLARALTRQLADQASPGVDEAMQIEKLLSDAVEHVGRIARGLYPIAISTAGIQVALEELARNTRALYDIPCRVTFHCATRIGEDASAHIYYLAQEAVNNAVKHGKATNVEISLEEADNEMTLSIEDNGKGVWSTEPDPQGMGVHIMRHRAGMIGGALELSDRPKGGTLVRCAFPLPVQDDYLGPPIRRDRPPKDSEPDR